MSLQVPGRSPLGHLRSPEWQSGDHSPVTPSGATKRDLVSPPANTGGVRNKYPQPEEKGEGERRSASLETHVPTPVHVGEGTGRIVEVISLSHV